MMRELVEFLKPNVKKVILALFLLFGWTLLGIYLLTPTEKTVIEFPTKIKVLNLLSYLLSAILYYPFSCAIIIIYEYYKRKEIRVLARNSNFLILIFLGIIIFNPIGIALSEVSLLSIFRTHPKGVVVMEVYQDSPTIGFGDLSEGKIITRINNLPVGNAADALEILSRKKPKEEIWINYDGRGTEYILAEHQNFSRGYLGIKVKDAQGIELVL